MKVFMIEIEILVLLIFIVIAIVAGYFQKKRRAKRKAKLEKELELQNLAREERKAQERKERLSISKAAVICGAHVPEDSMLRRHYITHLRTLTESLTGPRPTDSALRRHYDTHITSELEKCLQDATHAQRLIQNYETLQKSSAEQEVQQQPSADAKPQIKPAVKAAPVESVAPISEKEKKISCHIPQDSMLKRHFLSHLRSKIESSHAPRPAECALRRHYDTMIDAELDKQIKEMST